MSSTAPELDAASTLVGNETVYVVQNGEDRRTTTSVIAGAPTLLEFVTSTGTTLVLANATHNEKVVECGNAGATTVTLGNSLPRGFSCLVSAVGAGQLTFSAGPGATIRPANSLKTASQWTAVGVYVRSNANGAQAEYVLNGNLTP